MNWVERARAWLRNQWSQYWFEDVALLAAIAVVVISVATGIASANGADNSSNLILLVVGAGALPFAVWRSRSGQRQAKGTAEQADHAAEQAENARLTRLNDQFTSAATMLGNNAVIIRRLGIQSLQSLATDQPGDYYVRVLRSLCDYAREPYLRQGEAPYAVDESTDQLRSDVQRAVQSISDTWGNKKIRKLGRHTEKTYVPNLIRADLTKGLFWSLELDDAHLRDAICKNTSFANATLNGVNFTGAELTDADFTGQRIDDRGSKSPSTLKGALFENATCTNTDFSGTDLSGAICAGADFSGADFSEANLSGADFAAKTNPDGSIEVGPAQGLTQAQLDQACAEPDRPPKLDGVKDAETGAALVWRGQPCGDDSP